MALVVEDGTGLADATTFATRDELISWARARGVTVPAEDSTDVHLVNAMDFLMSKAYKGSPVNVEQGTPFPRIYINPRTNEEDFPSDAVPVGMKRAQLVLALASFQGVRLLAQVSAGPRVKSRDVGPLKRTYSDAVNSEAEVAGLGAFLDPFLIGAGEGFTLTTRRA